MVIALQVIILSHLFRFFHPLASSCFIAFFQITQPHQKIESIFIFLFPHGILEMPDRGVIVLGKESFACQTVPLIRIAHTVGIHASPIPGRTFRLALLPVQVGQVAHSHYVAGVGVQRL